MSAQLSEGQYKIVSALSGKVLSVNGGTANDGTEVVQWQDEGRPNQRWQLTKVAEEGGDTFYTIEHPGSGMVMEAPGPWPPGIQICMRRYDYSNYPKDNGKNHLAWRFEKDNNRQGVYKIVSRRFPFTEFDKNSYFVIDVQKGDPKNNPKMYASWTAPDDRQYWELVSVPAARLEAKIA